ncbi:MAG: hypothetical protein QOJ95_5137, partial [Mycobacterium sp.]|nr:hypothetical protein [Mycobacterium sp.]
GVPIWVSGTVNTAVARRISRFGSGWIPWGTARDDPAAAISAMKDAIADAGGDASGLQVQGNAVTVKRADGSVDVEATAASAPPLVEAGVTDVRFTLSVPRDRQHAVDLLSRLVGAFHAVTR